MKREMNRWKALWIVIGLGLEVLALPGCGAAAKPAATPTPGLPSSVPLPQLDGKRALFVVPDRFIAIEYRAPRRILEQLGATVTVGSWSLEALTGSSGDVLQPDVEIRDAHAGGFDAIVFLGGDRVKPTDSETQRLVQEAVAEGKVVAAICAAQGILKEAGLWEGGREGIYLERQGRIIAASGPLKAREFGEAIAAAMGE